MSEPDPKQEDRARKAARIMAEPTRFKVCESCDSIVAARVTMCPNCNGYRFDENPVTVTEHAAVLGSREQQSVVADDLE